MNEIKNFDKIKIRLASPEQILSWSYGEVKKPETINYRRLRPEVDGLFCERIFGTTKDWECFCGKFKSQRYKGVICERCGVEVTSSKVRRERMGHIKLVAPVSHIWYYRSNPSRIPLILGISKSDLRSVLYYEKYIVVNPQETGLKECQIMTEDEYNEANEIYGGAFTAGMGAEPIRELLSKINLDQKSKELREEMHRLEKESKGDTIKRTNILKRIEIVENFRISGNRPEWMILTVLPIIPPDLRPMIQLEGGRFATSDLNDLYRRVINRNNRLQRLIDMRAPETVLRNEKRMLQEAVDSLLDNSAQRRMVKGANNRPLKSLADALKGKQGRFRQNLLGKRVDYSGRSVIVIGPELKLYQCGLPSLMALELFKPFIMKRLLEENYASNVRRAKMMVEEETPEVWALLDSVVKEHPILLNRAPTLHRLSVQAFEPVLVDGKAIKLHPLVCKGFNADFDGDQMAVHVPLTVPAQIECWTLMLSATNMLDPASGKPVMYPSQDMVLGIHYLTSLKKGSKGEGKYFDDLAEIFMAVGAHSVDYNAEIVYKIPSTGEKIKTTVGRVIFNSFLPEGIPFQNETFGDKSLQSLVAWSLKNNPRSLTMRLLDSVKDCGFKYATIFGATLSPSDMLIPKTKNAIIEEANKKELEIISQFTQGAISKEEKYTRVLDLWRKTSDSLTEDLMKELEESQGGFNPLWLMAHSGARGSKSNFTQLGAMRGLMQKPNGETIELPVKSSFKEGLSLIEFYISTNGARKGLADTALKTSKAGHLTRRLVDVAQDIVISEEDCGTINGVYRTAVKDGDKVVQSLASRIAGRFSLERIVNPLNNEIIVDINQEITDEIAKSIEDVGVEGIICRSVLTCESKKGVCQKCYGRNLANNKICNIGDPVGIIAAQSIGQPGTQLTMRTFHEGGTASTKSENNEITFDNNTYIEKIRGSIVTKEDGTKLFVGKGYIYIKSITEEFDDIKPTVNEGQTIVNGMVIGKKGGEDVKASSNGFALILNGKLYLTKATESVEIRAGSQLLVSENTILNIGDALVRFDPHTEPILTEVSGKVSYVDIDPQTTLEEEIVEESEEVLKRISESTFMGLDPRIQILDNKGKLLATYNLPGGAELEVDDGQMVEKGSILAKLNRSSSFDSDITQGLPKIEELVEARIVNNPAVLAKVDGKVEFEGIERKNYRVVNVISDFGQKYKHLIPLSKHLLVRDGDHVETAERLCDGPINPYEMLEIAGESELYKFLINEIQQVYRSQNIEINDKHLAIILKQMLKKVKIVKVGDTNFVQNQLVDKHAFQVENERVASQGGESAIAKPLLQGISKTSLSNSFIAAASFQETTKILTNAAIAGSTDELTGLKENVIIGHAIPAGTGMKVYNSIEIIAPQNDDLDKKLEELKTEAERINSFKEEDWSLDEEYLSQDEAEEDDSYEDGSDN